MLKLCYLQKIINISFNSNHQTANQKCFATFVVSQVFITSLQIKKKDLSLNFWKRNFSSLNEEQLCNKGFPVVFCLADSTVQVPLLPFSQNFNPGTWQEGTLFTCRASPSWRRPNSFYSLRKNQNIRVTFKKEWKKENWWMRFEMTTEMSYEHIY